ncbi:MAG: thermonuclease family protein [Nanoarchaeota archaeon]
MLNKKVIQKSIRKRDIILLIALILALFILNYPILDNTLNNFLDTRQEVFVNRVIDGDTIESNDTSIRLLGINTPERGELYYLEAKEFLEQLVFNKTVLLEFGKERYDKYYRTLAYVFLENENINIKMVENGFGNYYFPSGKDKHYSEFTKAWDSCINSNINLCEASSHKCASCIILKDSETLENICDFSCDITGWRIKAEGRNNTIFQEKTLGNGEEVSFELDLTETGDTIFLWDEKGKLVLWKSI